MPPRLTPTLAVVVTALACGSGPTAPVLLGRTTSGVALPCYHATAMSAPAGGEDYLAIDARGLLHRVEVTRAEEDETCQASSDPAFEVVLEDLGASPVRDAAGRRYSRCTEASGLVGSHRHGRRPEGAVLLLRRGFAGVGEQSRTLPGGCEALKPAPPQSGPCYSIDNDRDDVADALLIQTGKAAELHDPDRPAFQYIRQCSAAYVRAAGAWKLAYRECADTCEPVTY